jgi:hypothetical protein
MLAYRLLYLISLVTFTFGALTFSVLTLSYWRERRSQRARRGGRIFPTFTLFCAAAFILNLMLSGASVLAPGAMWVTGVGVALDFVTGLLPPLLFHFIYRQEESGLRFRRAWGWVAAALYLAGAAGALAHNLPAWSDRWESVPALMLSLTTALALLLLILTRRPVDGPGRRQRWWYRILFGLTVLCAALDLAHPADYLLLAFFCVTLYYQERLVFFDLFIKRGAFFALSLAGLTLFFATAPAVYQRFPADWSRPWITALLLTPFWLMTPWIYRRLADAIDRVGLGRPYPAPEAERLFIAAVQLSASEEELRSSATGSLSRIFQAAAEVRLASAPEPAAAAGLDSVPGAAAALEPAAADDGLLAPIEQRGIGVGWLTLAARPNAIPFLSDDRRLLQSLARTLGVVLENVRFRQQQRRQEERAQELGIA